jgi:hypothetical protein
MRFRALLLAFLAICLAASPSFGTLCEVDCSFGGNGSSLPADHSQTMPLPGSAAAKPRVNHACCAARNARPAFVAHHHAAPEDCSVNPSLRPQFPTAVQSSTAAAGQDTIQNAASKLASLTLAEIPPLIESAASHPLPFASQASSILRV